MDTTTPLIIDRLDEIGTSLTHANTKLDDLSERLSKMEGRLAPLLGNGHPGTIEVMRGQVESHGRTLAIIRFIGGGIVALVMGGGAWVGFFRR